MIRNKQELRQVSERMSNRIKSDMRGKILSFIEQMGTNEVELANALDIPVQEVRRILEGDGEITLTTFVKILIGSNHALEIKPIANVPQSARNTRRNAPIQSEAPMRNRDHLGRFARVPSSNERIPSYEEFQQAVREGRIPPPPHGMCAPMGRPMTPPPPHVQAPQHIQSMQPSELNDANIELDSMTREELFNTIVQSDLANEFEAAIGRNISLARRGDMINFLLGKNFRVNHEERTPCNQVCTHSEESPTRQANDEVANLANVFANMLHSNPELKETLRRFL